VFCIFSPHEEDSYILLMIDSSLDSIDFFLTLWVALLFNLLGNCHQERFFLTSKWGGLFLFFATQQWVVGVFLIRQKKYARLQRQSSFLGWEM
jgi:hypothetical protein